MRRLATRLGLAGLAVVMVVSTGASNVGCAPPTSSRSSSSSSTHWKYGSVNEEVTQSNIKKTICKAGYTKTIRPPVSYTNKMKEKLMREQDWKGPRPILDHYIPLQGGGDPDDKKNFLLQTKKDSYKKDAVEDKMHDDICDGKVSLRKAQLAMSQGWENYERNVRR
jgi:hypothetical protein